MSAFSTCFGIQVNKTHFLKVVMNILNEFPGIVNNLRSVAFCLTSILLCGSFCCEASSSENNEASSESQQKQVITEIPSEGLVIDTSGYYVFGNDIFWRPSEGGQAISITADDVILDLQNHTLQSELTSYTTLGIVSTSANRLTIRNGTVMNMGFAGIQCSGGTQLIIENITVDGLNKDDVATFIVPVGIAVLTSNNVTIKNCCIKNIDVRTDSLSGIQITSTEHTVVSNCLISNLINRDGACVGIGFTACEFATIKSCRIDQIKSEFVDNLLALGHTSVGILPALTLGVIIKDCTISNITGCCDDAHGISVFECAGAIIKRCGVDNVINGVAPSHTGAKATGIEIYSSKVRVSKCKVKNITAINPLCKQATGFSCAQCVDVKFIDCFAENILAVDEHGQQNFDRGYGIGFGWAPEVRPVFTNPAIEIFHQKCTAKNCQIGFDTWYHINCVWDHIVANNCQIPILDPGHVSRVLMGDACSEAGCSPDGGLVVVTLNNVAHDNTFLHTKVKFSK